MKPFSVRQTAAAMMNGGAPLAEIARECGVSTRTARTWRAEFKSAGGGGGAYVATRPPRAVNSPLTRAHLEAIQRILREQPKLTLHELRRELVAQGVNANPPSVPTLFRRLKALGYAWQKTRTRDLRAGQTLAKYELCRFKQAQRQGVADSPLADATRLVFLDESNFFYKDQTQARAWAPRYHPVTLPKPKGKGVRRNLYLACAFAYDAKANDYRAFIHWVLVPPRRSHRPLPSLIQPEEVGKVTREAKRELKRSLSPEYIASLGAAGLREELKRFNVRPGDGADAMRGTLTRIAARGSAIGERRAGREYHGGARVPHTGTARGLSDYLLNCLSPYLADGKLHNGAGHTPGTSADETLAGCPDYGKREFAPPVRAMRLVLDNAQTHLPPPKTDSGSEASPFHGWVRDRMRLEGCVFLPPYAPHRMPAELAFSYLKRATRHTSTAHTDEELCLRLREATDRITGRFLAGWALKCGFQVPGPVGRKPLLPKPVRNVCSRPCDGAASFKGRTQQHVACASADGRIQRLKQTGHSRFSVCRQREDGQGEGQEGADLKNVSAVGASGLARRKKHRRPRAQERKFLAVDCEPPADGKTRWTGVDPAEDHKQLPFDQLCQGPDDFEHIQFLVRERAGRGGDGKPEFLVRWRGFGADHDSWVSGLSAAVVEDWRARAERIVAAESVREADARAARLHVPDRSDFREGDVVAIRAPRGDPEPFYVARVVEDQRRGGRSILVQWMSARSVEGSYNLLLNNRNQPYTQRLESNASVIDKVPSLLGKRRGKISREDLNRIRSLLPAG